MNFDADRQGTGTREWAEKSFNIGKGCGYGCRYCYARANALRFKQIKMPDEWLKESITLAADIVYYPAGDGVVMFPTTHDLTPFYLHKSIPALREILKAGRKLLITTKASMYVMRTLTTELADWKDQIMFRITIGTTNDRTAQWWEPYAPTVTERIMALRYAFEHDWQTSVSCEPMLGGVCDTVDLIQAVNKYVTDTIWIGKMNSPRRRCAMSEPGMAIMVGSIEDAQSDERILELVDYVKSVKKIRWKDSIKKVIGGGNGR